METKDDVKNAILPGGVKQSQINAWKREHDEVYSVSVKDGDKEFTGYFKKPDLAIIGLAGKYAQESTESYDPIKSGNIIFDNCWLGGDKEIQEQGEYKLAAISKIGRLFRILEADIKKL
jgi:hypothetical protein